MIATEVMRKALEALTCSGEPDDPGHRCGHCDDYVDRNGPVRAALRAELERLDAVEPVVWGVAYSDSGELTDLFFAEDEARIEAENCGWTARVVPLYTAPIAPAIPALTCRDMALRCPVRLEGADMEQGLESEDYRAWDKAKQEKRADNRAQSASILARAGVIFESRNDGAHLVVLAGAHVVDFWPGTGLWIVRGSQARKRGVRALLAFRTAQIQPSNASK